MFRHKRKKWNRLARLIQVFIGPDHRVLYMRAFFSVLVHALSNAEKD